MGRFWLEGATAVASVVGVVVRRIRAEGNLVLLVRVDVATVVEAIDLIATARIVIAVVSTAVAFVAVVVARGRETQAEASIRAAKERMCSTKNWKPIMYVRHTTGC